MRRLRVEVKVTLDNNLIDMLEEFKDGGINFYEYHDEIIDLLHQLSAHWIRKKKRIKDDE